MEVNQRLLRDIVQTDKCEITTILLKSDIDVNYVDADGKFPLYYAYEKNMISQMQILILHGANVNQTYKSKTILFIECHKQKSDSTMIKLLMNNKADPNIISKFGAESVFPLWCLVESANIDNIKLLLSYPQTNINLQDSDGVTALRKACSYGLIEIPFLLLDEGADPNIQGSEGYSALMRSVLNGNNATVSVLLLHDDVKLNLQDRNGDTALHHACANDKITSMHLLLKHGADRTIKNNDGKIATECCVSINVKQFYDIYCQKNDLKLIVTAPTVNTNKESDLIFKVPNPNNRPIRYVRPMIKYRMWNDVFRCWNKWTYIPAKKMTCEYIDEKVPYHIICSETEAHKTYRVQFSDFYDEKLGQMPFEYLC
uniref:Uncharacterized protein n=1 Tax=viral metagenome TaxID=1070528 RepID=A0A6C0CAL1_9ZZZZ